MDIAHPIFLGLDIVALVTLPTMVAMFGFAVWWGMTRSDVGIDADEQERRIQAKRG